MTTIIWLLENSPQPLNYQRAWFIVFYQRILERYGCTPVGCPHVITEYHRQQRVECCTNMLQSFESRITKSNLVTVDEKWFYCRRMLPRNVIGSWIGPDGDRKQTAVRSKFETKFLAIVAVSTRGIHFFQVLDIADCNLCDWYVFPRLEAIRGRGDFNTKDELTQYLGEQSPLLTQQRMAKALAKMAEDFRKIIENQGHYL